MKCINCNQEVKDGAVFCGFCGARQMVQGLRSKEEMMVNNNVVPVPPPKEEKKKKGGCCGCFFTIIMIILVIFGVIKLIDWYKDYSYNKNIQESLLVDKKFDNILSKVEKAQDWNGDGISNEEANKLGLNPSVSDSDGDGLSDAEEVYIYKSDPKKYSTSGDIYSDGYKVKLGYDLNKKYETFAIKDTTKDNIKVEIDCAEDMSYYYKDYTGAIPDGFYLGEQPFRIFSFEGEVDVELENPKNYHVISYDLVTEKVSNINSRVENDNLVFKVKDDNPVLIVYKDSVLKKMDQKTLSTINDKYENDVKKEYFVVAFPLINVLFKQPVFVLEIEDGLTTGKDGDVAFEKEINEKAGGVFTIDHYYTNEWGVNFIQNMLGGLTSEVYTNVGEENKSFINYIVMYKRVSSKNELYQYLLGEFGEEEEEKEEAEEEDVVDLTDPFAEKYSNMNCTYCADSGFKVDVNAFPFQNLSTEVSSGGVCAGFSHVTTNIYNKGSMPNKVDGKYDMSDWDYTGIWNKNLYNYKPTDKGLLTYADNERRNEVKLNSNTMSKPDSEVVKALEYYWDEANIKLRMSKFGWAWNHSFEKESYISEDTMKAVVNKFKSGQIVSVMLLSDGQHAINAYKITEDKNDPDILYIKAYDNNFPNDLFWNSDNKKVKYDVTITMKRIYENTLFGVKTKYSYTYSPINAASYSYGTYNNYGGLLFVDENNKIL